ncbi:MAG: hypothetical protein IKU42_07620 [Oscillospiraceae bacterium]|nr:hypothetical protein [Oscillospiraceae bacterium]
MAEHEEKIFEHEIAEQLKKFDSDIKIPEISDAQRIFELAEKETKVVSIKNYRKIIGIAAAVVLVFISVPVLGGILSGNIGMDMAASEAAEEPSNRWAYDEPVEEYVMDSASEAYAEESDTVYGGDMEPPQEPPQEGEPEVITEENSYNDAFEYAVFDFLTRSEIKATSGTDSKNSGSLPAVKDIEEAINSKRSIDISIESESVSVLLYDTSADNEVISAFWVEGSYQGSGTEDKYYYIELMKVITLEDFENESWLPMVGDAEKGTYFIDKNMISLPDEIEHGIIFMKVLIDISSGEYSITASII